MFKKMNELRLRSSRNGSIITPKEIKDIIIGGHQNVEGQIISMPSTPYYYIQINGVIKLFHKYLLEKFMGLKVPRGYVVHHKDCNKINNNLNNLIMVSHKTHAQIHGMLRRNQN